MSIIKIENLTKDYGHERGIFDISIEVNKGECFGFLGPNGAGKTTTIRHLMGFSKAQKGKISINGLDCWENYATLQNNIGYLPGEIALPTGITGTEFIKMMMNMRNIKNDTYLKMLLDKFSLDPNMDTKKMSLGVKRKLAVVTAFLHDPDILILDEPTSGLDPIMQDVFIQYILEEKKRGKTIFLSSHIFNEVDATCDKIAIIKDGHIVSKFIADDLKNTKEKTYRITFEDKKSYDDFIQLKYHFSSKNQEKLRARVHILTDELDDFVKTLTRYNIADFHEIPFTLEDYFMKFYKEDKEFKGVE